MWTLGLDPCRLGVVPYLDHGRRLRARQPSLRQLTRKDTIMYRRYGIINFIFDIFMVSITGGLWLIWIFAREMRRR